MYCFHKLIVFNNLIYLLLQNIGHSQAVVGSETVSNDGSNDIDSRFTDLFPLVQLVGNYRIVLEHYPRKLSASGRYEVR